jgi:type IV pilus assembly protein PilX
MRVWWKTARQRGIVLLLSLLMLIAVMLIGASAAHMALQGEKAARGERDREVAFLAAEDALADAEREIQGGAMAAPVAGVGALAGAARLTVVERGAMFGPDAGPGFAADCGGAGGVAGIDGGGGADVTQGLRMRAASNATPVWQSVDLSGAEDAGLCSVPYGAYTGAAMQTGQGFLPFQKPRYVIERLLCHQPGEDATAAAAPEYCYRVTALGFGPKPATEVVLQSVYRKAE